jgi:hypothetical protein
VTFARFSLSPLVKILAKSRPRLRRYRRSSPTCWIYVARSWKIMEPAKITPEMALASPPGLGLNVFVFEYVLGGVVERSAPMYGRDAGQSDREEPYRIPNCSMLFGDCHMVMIKVMAENQEDELVVSWGGQHFDAAKGLRFISSEKQVPVWRLSLGGGVAYGRSFQEAICKLAIVLEMKRGTPA